MKKIILAFVTLSVFTSFSQEITSFKKPALNEVFIDREGNTIAFKDLLAKYKGQTIFIDIWASWCSDCVGSIPELKDLQKKEKEVVFVMLSLDKNINSWKAGIKKHALQAEHYLFTKKWKKSAFCASIVLDWIPRYMIVGKDGTIKMYKAIKFSNPKIIDVIRRDKKG